MPYERPAFWQWRPHNKKKVAFSTSPSQGLLQRTNSRTKFANYDTGNTVQIVVDRDAHTHQPYPHAPGSTGSYSTLSVSPHLSPNRSSHQSYNSSPGGSALTPSYTPLTSIDSHYFDRYEYETINNSGRDESTGEVHVSKQPYRTTPLVLPGAKVNKGQPKHTETYLRYHPDPSMRAPPHQFDRDHIIKQKIANTVLDRISTGDPNKQLVHKQFNSPISAYSETNIIDAIHKQTGIIPQIKSPSKRPLKFNPAESETFKALQEDQESRHFNAYGTRQPQSQRYF